MLVFRNLFSTCCVVALMLHPAFLQGNPAVENLGARYASIDGDWLVYSQWESFLGRDLNGDGDTEDAVVQLRNLETGQTTNLKIIARSRLVVEEDWLVIPVFESDQGRDPQRRRTTPRAQSFNCRTWRRARRRPSNSLRSLLLGSLLLASNVIG